MLTLPDVAERMGVDVVHVRTLIKDDQLLAVRDDQNRLVVPARLLDGAVQVKHLPAVITLLRDGRYSDEEALRWLTTPDDSIPGTPLQALRENRGTEIKRRAQALGF